ncbi:hypothetical protein D1AOALGA4SA_3303, partial [Olavius algarvensis Delta 1 endosymbiont]
PHITALLRGFFTFVTLTSVMALFPAMAFGEPVTLAWDANQESDLKGYILYYGTDSGNYSNNTDVGNVTQHTTPDLQDGVTYYFAVTAYNDADIESDYSEELSHTVGVVNNNPSKPTTPNSPDSGIIDTSYTFNTNARDPDGDSVEYQFDWGDGTSSSWGAASRNHAWSTAGTFCIKARARDTYASLSEWSDCHYITISKPTHTITASAGSNGNISPSGTVVVSQGSDKIFTIAANQNYQVSEVLVDGSSEGAITSYTFTNVTGNHTISANFKSIEWTHKRKNSHYISMIR